MDDTAIATALERAEKALDLDQTLNGTGFWPAVAAVKQSPDLTERYADRIAVIDQRAFSTWPLLNIPLRTGTALALLAVAGGLGAVAASYSTGEPWNWVLFWVGVVVLIASTHGLAHLAVGSAVGIGFTCWFVASIKRPQPGVKVDYSTYLRVSPSQRAWMHASGAIASKVVPALLIPAAIVAELPAWVVWALGSFVVATIVTDIVWSTKSSDWMKFRREMGYR